MDRVMMAFLSLVAYLLFERKTRFTQNGRGDRAGASDHKGDCFLLLVFGSICFCGKQLMRKTSYLIYRGSN